MGVIPTDTDLVPPDLLHHLHHVLLINWIDSLNRDCGAHLGHREDINHMNGVVIVDLADHESHNFEGHTCRAVLHHFQQRQ